VAAARDGLAGVLRVPDEAVVPDVLAEVPGELPDAPLVLGAEELSVWVPGAPEAPSAVPVERVSEFLDEPAVQGESPAPYCFQVSDDALPLAYRAQGAGTAAAAVVAVRACFQERD
jgi:hypothetical protein